MVAIEVAISSPHQARSGHALPPPPRHQVLPELVGTAVIRQTPEQLVWPEGQPHVPLVQTPPVGEPQTVPLVTLVQVVGGVTLAAATQVWQVVDGLAWPLL